jgi:hypothetical protein
VVPQKSQPALSGISASLERAKVQRHGSKRLAETELGFLSGLDEAHSGEFFQVVGDRRPGYGGLVGERRSRYLGFTGNALENLHPPSVRERAPDSIELLLIHHGLQVAYLSFRGFIRFRIRTTVPFSSNETSSMSVLMR